MYVDPTTRQTFEFANQRTCENNRKNVIALDRDTDQYYVLSPQRITFLYSLNPLRFKLLLAPTHLLLKTQVFLCKWNSNILGIVFTSLNILIIL